MTITRRLRLAVLGAAMAIASCTNRPPQMLNEATGPVSGVLDSTYTFSTIIDDRDRDRVSWRFTWGDGDTSAWTEFTPCDSQFYRMSHAWRTMDTFSVRVQVRDQHGAETDWSSPHDIAIGCPFALRVAEGVPFYIPTACALSPLGDYLYVCQAGGGVLRLRTRDGRIDTLYQSLSISLAMAVHPGGSRLYCITFDGIEVVNLPQGTLDTVVDVWPWTGMTAKVLPNGQYLCVVYDSQGPDSSAVCVVRTQDNSLVKAVPVGPAPYGLATLPGSDYVYVSSAHDSSVLAIRVDDPAVTATIPVGPRPRGIVASPDGSRVYVACEGDTVWVIDPTVNQVIDRLPVSSYGYDLDITSDGRYLFGADYSGGIVWVVHLASRKVASGVQAPAPRQVAVSSAGHRVYVRSWTDFGIRVIEY